ncbi:hypothetical protein Tco_0282350, partial [Tanacetum coccineum]
MVIYPRSQDIAKKLLKL